MSTGKATIEPRDETIHLVYLRRDTAARLQVRFWEMAERADSLRASREFKSLYAAFCGYLSGRAERIEIKQPAWWFGRVLELSRDAMAGMEIGLQVQEGD